MTSYHTLWPYFLRHRYRLAAGLFFLILVDLIQLIIPRLIKHAVDDLTNFTATLESLVLAALGIIGLAALIAMFRYLWRRLIMGFSRIAEEDLRNRLYAKILSLPPAWFLQRTSGDIMARATNDIEAVRMASGMGLVALVDALLMSTASVAFMIWISLELTLWALIPMPLIAILTARIGGAMHRRYLGVQNIFGRLTEQAREFLSGIRVIKAQAREDLVIQHMDRIGREYVRENIRLNWISGAFYPLMVMFGNLSLAIVLYFGGRMTIFGHISPGDFVAFIAYLGLLTWPMMAIGWVTNLVQRGAASLDRINMVLDYQSETTEPEAPVSVDHFQGGIQLRNLTFSYPGRQNRVLNEVTLDFPPGKITAVVGRTGSGKSTLLGLIPRLFDPPSGTVWLDGVDVRELRLSDLRGAIGYVPQDGYIFSGTMACNIAFGRPTAGEEEIEAAARLAELHEEIMSFPQGYQTHVGERGLTLSGGQKQRLALARALLLDPPLLLLDDTFSAVDASTEERILETLSRIRAGKSTIIVSHRLTSLRDADLIHVLDGGRVRESGSHADLLKSGGYYAQLYRLQQVQAEFLQQAEAHEAAGSRRR